MYTQEQVERWNNAYKMRFAMMTYRRLMRMHSGRKIYRLYLHAAIAASDKSVSNPHNRLYTAYQCEVCGHYHIARMTYTYSLDFEDDISGIISISPINKETSKPVQDAIHGYVPPFCDCCRDD